MADESTSRKIPLSIIVITKDEEQNIKDCLQGVAWADEIIVVDAQSSDKTVEYAKQYTGKVFVTEWLGFAGAKNRALSKVTNKWVFWLDADERVNNGLANEIQVIVSQNSAHIGAYEVARRAYFLGKWIKHCGWYPGYVTRLFKTEGAQFNDALVHEKLEIKGIVGRLKNDVIHLTDNNLSHYFSKFNHYTSLAADELDEKGRAFSLYDLLVRPPFLFFKMYIFKLGFLDGMRGLILSVLSSAYVFTKYAKLWEKHPGEG